MLMNIDCSIVQSLKLALTFDDNKTKEREIATGDLCYFEFNKNGKRKTIEGKVIKISVSSSTDIKSWFIVVDGSLDYAGQMERFCPNQVLDCDIIQKHDTVQYINTPNDSTRITDMRFSNGYIQISNDGGYSWMTPKNLNYEYSEDEEDEDGCVVVKPVKPKKKKILVITDEDDTEDSDSEDEDTIEDEVY